MDEPRFELSSTEIDTKLAATEAMRRHLDNALPPGWAMAFAILALWGALQLLEGLGIMQFTPAFYATAPLLSFVLVYLPARARHRRWVERLDAMLAAYAPLDRDALSALQGDLARAGRLDDERIRDWLIQEQAELLERSDQLPLQPTAFTRSSRFLSRSLQ